MNLGDSYSSSSENGSGEDEGGNTGIGWVKHQRRAGKTRLPEKCQLLIPQRFAIQMVDKVGYVLRNQIVWYKRNCMPSSAESKFTVDWEPFFFFVKDPKKYYFKQQFEPTTGPTNRGEKRNRRSVWDVPTEASEIKHAAMFPENLVSIPILACCPENGIVLDPFAGANTTGLVAKKLGRNYISFELNPEFVSAGQNRTIDELGLFA